mgnify:CR=1 FL=1
MFCTRTGAQLDRHDVLRESRTIMRKAGLNDKEWTTRGLRHTFVSRSPTTAAAWKRSHSSSATTTPTPPNASTATNSDR